MFSYIILHYNSPVTKTKGQTMFRNNISVYVDDEEMAKKVREYAQKLRQERGQRTYIKPIQLEPEKPAFIQPVKDSYQEAIKAIKPQQEMPKLPPFLLEVMNGGTFPQPEDLTKAEQAILYDNQINTLVNLYRKTKKADLAQHIRERLDELGVDF